MTQRRRSRTGLHVGSGEGLVVTVALVDAVQLSAHTVAVRLCGAAGERQENGYDGQQMFHGASLVSYPLFFRQPVIKEIIIDIIFPITICDNVFFLKGRQTPLYCTGR